MGMRGCYALLKYLLVIFNLLFLVAGIGLLALSGWMLIDNTLYISMAQDEESYRIGIYLLLFTGSLMFIVGFLGCCGALKESRCLLVSFFCFLLIIIVAEVSAGVWAYINSSKLEELVKETMKMSVQEEYSIIDSRTVTFDTIQQELKCCGANGPTDWAASKYNSGTDKVALAVSSTTKLYKIPPSCCSTSPDDAQCTSSIEVPIAASIPDVIYKHGCIDKVTEYFREHIIIVLGVGIGILVVETLGLLFSLILCCDTRSPNRYKS